LTEIKQTLPTYGRDLIPTLDPALFDDCLVFAAPEAWDLIKHEFHFPPKQVVQPKSMEQSKLERQVDRVARCETVFGIGGGSAIDAAKMFAWKNGGRLILVPSILSADAPFTKAVAVRVDHRVRYVGEVFPDHLLIDFALLEQAPAKLNHAGVGNILSIYTALADWKIAAETNGEAYDAGVAAHSQALLDRMFAGRDAIRDVTEDGLKLLSELFLGEVALCEQFGDSRPREGSEHYFAYAIESLTRKRFIHGELIALGVLLAAIYQDQPVAPIIDFLEHVGVEFRPAQVGVSEEDIRAALLALPEYLQDETQLLYGVFHHKGVSTEQADAIIAKLNKFAG
jgi:glycerol-1-phosphate dehydrogenase [NAD(P)+]